MSVASALSVPERYVTFVRAPAAAPMEAYVRHAGIRLVEEQVERGVRFPVFSRAGVMLPFTADRLRVGGAVRAADYLAQIAASHFGGPTRLLDVDERARRRSAFHLRILLGTSRFTELRAAYRTAMQLERGLQLAYERPSLLTLTTGALS